MPYIQRDNTGSIVSIKRENDTQHDEFLSPTDNEIVAFLTDAEEDNSLNAKIALSESDQGFTRATEDLIHLLIQKNIILFTELPDAVQIKMAGREKLRSTLEDSPYNFLDNSDSI
jgi:hypothetical protein